MSVEVNTLEQIIVYNHTNETRLFIEELRKHYYAIDYNQINCLEISLDEEYFKEDTIQESSLEKIRQKDFQYPFYQLLANAPLGNKLSIKIGYNGFNEKYGYEYWLDVLTDDLKPYVVCKCLEYYDQDDDIVTYVFDKTHSDTIPWKNKKEDVLDVDLWYGHNFSILVEGDGEISLENEEIGEYLFSFAKKLKDFDSDIDAYFEEGVFEVSNSINIPGKSIGEFVILLEDFYQFCLQNYLECQLVAAFLADDWDNKFAALEIVPSGDRISVNYCRF